jgi:SAM-dependent methyltransferase
MITRSGASLSKAVFDKAMRCHYAREEANVLRLMEMTQLPKTAAILDVGCGKGRYLALLARHGYKPTGVDASNRMIDESRAKGFVCLNDAEFMTDARVYDMILMAHVIEHLSPGELLLFMDRYLDRLRLGGFLIIATPLLTPGFYNDFDHVRPYYPLGIDKVFEEPEAQVQFEAKNRLKRLALLYRQGPFHEMFLGRCGPVATCITTVGLIAYMASFGLVSMRTGWSGLYKKTA